MNKKRDLDKLRVVAQQNLEEREFWLNKISGELAKSYFPYDYKKAGAVRFSMDSLGFVLPAEIADKLIRLSNEYDYMLYMALAAGLVVLLDKYIYKGNKDIIVGAPIYKQEIEGDFVNTVLVLRNPLHRHMTFKELLLQVRDVVAAANENQNYPVELLLEHLNLNVFGNDFPLFDIAILLENIHDKRYLENVPLNMILSFKRTNNSIEVSMEYNASLYRKSTIERIITHFIAVLREALADIHRRISGISILSGKEKEQLLFEFNDTEAEYPKDKTIHELFAEQANITPDAVAVVGSRHSTLAAGKKERNSEIVQLTYRELNQSTNRLARLLREKGVIPDTIVGIIVERSIEMVIGIMGILKAGGAYLPIEPDYPTERIKYMLEDSKAKVLLAAPTAQVKVVEDSSEGIEIIDISNRLSSSISTLTSTCQVSPANLAYVIYTSGTTGKSKGTLTSHTNVIRVIRNTNYIDISEQDRILQLSNYAFDGSVFDIYGALLNGAALVMINKEDVFSVDNLAEVIKKDEITVFFVTTALFNTLTDLRVDCLDRVRKVLFGGELVSVEHSKRALEYVGKERILHVYGPTETTVYATYYPINEIEEGEGTIPIGRPIANTVIYILDTHLNPVPAMVCGEIYIGGDGVSRGYLNNPELTAEKFFYRSYRSYRSYSSKIIYKTGDLARWLPDGNIEFLGRMDHQVKLRGYRVELEEIENRLRKHDAVKEAVVLTREGKEDKSDKYLCAYILLAPGANEPVPEPELKEFLAEVLPAYMIPAYFVQLKDLPMTLSGKIDRKALLELIGVEGTGTKPRDELERKLADMWSQLLEVEKDKIGIDVSFFQLGGHSLKVTSLVFRIHKEMNVKVTPTEVFRRPTIRQLAEYISGTSAAAFISIQPVEKREYYGLSSAQERLFIIQQMDIDSIAYNIPMVLVLEGELDRGHLEKTMGRLIKRHESLRTSFVTVNREPVQKIHADVEFKIEYYDLAAKNAKERESIIEDFIKPFDLSTAPLLRVGLIKMGEKEHLFMIDMHHIITDGTSIGVFTKEIMLLYGGEELEPLRLQYKDHREWWNKEKCGESIKKKEDYWLREFAGEIPLLNLPGDYSRPLIQSFEGNTLSITIGEDDTRALGFLALEQGATLFMLLLAIYNVLLAALSGQEDIIVGTPTAGRQHPEFEDIIGMFVNTLAVRNYPAGRKKFAGFLEEVKERTLEAFDNQEYQFEDLVNRVAVRRDVSRNPLFDVMFALQNMETAGVEVHKHTAGLKLKPHNHKKNVSRFDLTLTGVEVGGTLYFTFEYCTRLFKEETMERFAGYFKRIVSILVKNPEKELGAIEIISEDEKRRILFDINRTFKEFPKDKTIHELFEEQVEKNPDKIAVVYIDRALTFRELKGKVNQAARILGEKGTVSGAIVGIMVERSLEMVGGILGILKAGAAYLPVHPDTPRERIGFMLADSNAKVLLTVPAAQVKVEVKEEPIEIIDISEDFNSSTLPSTSTSASTCQIGSANLAYVIYTSGSTGRPKGVMIEHRGVINILDNLEQLYPLEKEDAYLLKTNYTFDVSVTELFGWFFGKGKLIILEEGSQKDAGAIIAAIGKYGVTHINFVPSMLNVFLQVIAVDVDAIDIFAGLKYVFVAGEAFKKSLAEKIAAFNVPVNVENIFGPTEATIYTTKYSLTGSHDSGSIPIGKPLNNIKNFIMDKINNLQPVSVVGELCIGGVGLARGYLNRPELTNEKFTEIILPGRERLYRTGDLARWLPDGNIEFLGRMDHQVKLRGYRIELEEIETRLLEIKGIKEAVVIEREDETSAKYLCAYMITNGEIDTLQIKRTLSQTLPDYMIPSYVVELDKMPLTPNGKIDRKSLPDPGFQGGEYAAPRSEVERKLVEIWSEVLGIKKEILGIDDNFFKLGGHSLKATIMVSEIHKKMSVKMSLTEVFRYFTIRQLAEYIREEAGDDRYASIPSAEKKDYYGLSSAQKRLYLLQQMKPDITTYNMPMVVKLEGSLDKDRFETAFRQLLARHESLRTSFEMKEKEPVQRIHDEVEFEIEYYDGKLPTVSNFIRPFDLSKAPLLRVGLMETGKREYILMQDMHHIISDGTSMGVFRKEFMSLYAGEELEPLKIQYRDYSEWQNKEKYGEPITRQEDYWLREFSGEIPVLNLPTDYTRPLIQDFEGNTLTVVMGEEDTAVLRSLALKEEATLFMLLLAIYNVLLSKLGGQEDIIVGIPTAGRRHADLQQIIGMFVNTLALRNYPVGEKPFNRFLEEVKERTLEAFENQEYPFEELVETAAIDRDASRNPLFDVMFTVQDLERTGVEIPGLKLKPYEHKNRISKVDITLWCYETKQSLMFTGEYCTKIFKEETIRRLVRYLLNIVKRVCADPGIPIAGIDILTGEEKQRLLFDFNDTASSYPGDQTIHELFEEQAARVPDGVSIVGSWHRTLAVGKEESIQESIQLTYRQLNEKSNQLAYVLRHKGVEADTIVGIMVERCLEMIIGILAILKAGGAYLPIESDTPGERVKYMLEDSSAKVLVTASTLAKEVEKLGSWEVEKVFLEEMLETPGSSSQPLNLSTSQLLSSSNLAYIIYTSGTTGRPKGTLVAHYNVIRVVKNTNYIRLRGEDRVLQLSNYAFDGSVFDIYGALLNGSVLVMMVKEDVLSVQRLSGILKREGITVFFLTTALFNALVDLDIGCFSRVRKILFGGERISVTHTGEALEYLGPGRIIHVYGPTETTVYATYYNINLIDERCETIPIGSPISNTTAYIMGKRGELVPLGVSGELFLGGDGTARGYLNDVELTAGKFIENPFIPGERLYRTGDIVRRNEEGEIEFIGRSDCQVKIRGFRIELGEIENRLLTHHEIKEAVVVSREDQEGASRYLCAYFVSGYELSVPQLRKYLSQSLPDYMIPSYFVQIDRIPLTPNGKVDGKALPEPESGSAVEEYIAPGDIVEWKLAAIWSDVLNIDKDLIGIDTDFFELGGHSLKATLMVAKIHKELNKKVPLAEIFRGPTIRELAGYIKNLEEHEYASIEFVEEREYYVLSPAQKRMYLLQQMEPGITSYNIPTVVKLGGTLDKDRFEKTFRQLISRHESLRTSFIMVEDEPIQRIHEPDEIPFGIEYYDQELPTVSHFVRPFALSQAPLLRVGLIKEAEEKHILMLDMHHIISDGTSMGVFRKEFMSLYGGRKLELLKTRYRDYSEWQNKRKYKEPVKKREDYWLKEYAGEIPVLNLPTDYPRPLLQDFEGKTLTVEIGENDAAALRALALKEEATVFMLLLAIYNVLLSKLSGQEDVVMGTPTAGRRHVDLQHIIGMFVNTLALRNHPAGEKPFNVFLQEVKEKTLAAFENQEYPFEELVEKVAVSRDAGRNPLFDVMFGLQNLERTEVEIPGLKLNPYEFENKVSRFDITFLGYEAGQTLIFTIEYSTKIFRVETIQRLFNYLLNIIKRVCDDPGIRTADIDILTGEEKHRLLFDCNDTAVSYPGNKTIHELFEEQVERNVDGTAVVCAAQRQITYGELSRKSGRMAYRLKEKGVEPGSVVGIMAERSLEMIIGLLGILKAGAAYLPFEPDYPEERVKYMLADSKAAILLDVSELTDMCRGTACRVPWHQPSTSLAYVIYTSGTTGSPRGVMVEHKSVIRLVKNTNFIEFKEDDRILQTGVLSFDASTFEIWGPLLNGLVLYITGKEEILASNLLKGTVEKCGITTLWMTASLFNQMVDTDIEIFAGPRNLLVGGEALSPLHINKVRTRFPALKVINGYGPTENTTFSATYLIDKDHKESIPIGKPIANSTAYIVYRWDKLVPVGVVGELCVGGDGVSRGYLNNPELTAEKYCYRSYRSYRSYSSEKIYRTGDLARWLPDGNIEFVGRYDHQVKIRGFRIELGEIENRLLRHHKIKEAVVVSKNDQQGTYCYLCAYFVSESELSTPQLREYLSTSLPEYMIPSYFVQIDNIPLTPNGKVDRKALPSPGPGSAAEEYTAPRDIVGLKLVEIWSDVLNIDKDLIGIDTDFFELGGHSLKATLMVARIHEELNKNVLLAEIFRNPTIRELAGYIKNLEEHEYASIELVEKKEYYVLSSAQKRMYLLQQMEPEITGYNIPTAAVLEGCLDKDRFEKTFKQLISRHESLRTSFEMKEEEPVQRIQDEVEFEIEHISVGQKEQDEELCSGLIRNFVRPFDHSQAPLLRVGLIKVAEEEHILMVDMHHVISDGTSMEILKREFMSLYGGEELEPLRIQYRDYTEWQNKAKYGETIKQQEDYWLKEFAGEIPLLKLPTDYPRPLIQGFEGNTITVVMGEDDTAALRSLVLKEEATLFMLLLAIYNVLLAKLSGQEDMIVGTASAGRRHADCQQIIGMFVNTLALRNKPEGKKTFEEFLEEVKERTLETFENQEYQFEDLVEKVSVRRDTGRNPLFDVMFVLQNVGTPEVDVPGLKVMPYEYQDNMSKFDITLAGLEAGDSLFFSFNYCTKLYRKSTIERFINYFKKIVTTVVEAPGKKIAEIEIITEEERRQVLYDFNRTAVSYPQDKTIHELFAEQVEKTPDSIAVVGEERRVGATPRGRPDSVVHHLTYRELNEKANRLSYHLKEKGLGPDTIAGIMVAQSIELIVGILGILKAGAAYLPIDPQYPQERIDFMLKDSNAKILLSEVSKVSKVSGGTEVIDLPSLIVEKEAAEPTHLTHLTHPTHLCYVIYTSGTTGKPKGVMVEHRSLINLCYWHIDYYGVDEWDHATKYAGIGFDASVWEIFPYLIKGASLYIIDDAVKLDINELNEYYERNDISISFLPTQFCEQFMELENRSLRILLTGGDKLRIFKRKNYDLYNNYGPTENTVVCTSCLVERYDGNIPIGKPIANNRIYIFDRNYLHLQPIGVVGELCIGGDSLARGYLHDEMLTSEKFIDNPAAKGERIYKTGDLARWLPDGNIEFWGRVDYQVKVRGFRIELGEIERQLLSYNEIKEVIVVLRETDRGIQRYLCAYFVSESELSIPQLRNYLSKSLPDYMIPSYFVQVDRLPLTPNGKVDRSALPVPDATFGEEYAAPTNEVEKLLVKVWQEILGVRKIGIGDNFFDIGGDSIKAIQIAARMNKAGYRIEMRDIFLAPVISQLALKVRKLERIPDQSAVTGIVPLTPIQKWFFENRGVGRHHFNQTVMLYSEKGFEKDAITAIFTKIQEHHDALRMTYNEENNTIIQTNHGLDYPFSLEDYDLRGQEQEEAGEELTTRVNKIQASINLEKGPLMKLGLFHLDDGDRLLIVIHHLVIDGISWRILLEDMETLYQQYQKKEQLGLPLKTDSFKVWSVRLSQYADSELFLKEKAYWTELESTEVPGITKDFETGDIYVRDSVSRSFGLSVEETGLLLTRVNGLFGTEINDILLSALGLSLKKSFGVEKVLVALEGHGREEILPGNDVDINRTIGWFTSIYPVIFDFSYDADLARQIKEVKECLRRIPDKGIGYGILKYLTADEHKERLDSALNPQISFNYLGQFDADVEKTSFGIARESAGNPQSLDGKRDFELDVSGMITDNRLVMTVTYNKYQFKSETMERLLADYKNTLSYIVLYCSSREEKELTPSDLMYKEFSIEEVDGLRKQYALEDIYPLSPMQEGMYFHYLYDSASLAYFEQFSYRHHGELEIKWVERSLRELFKRHDILRTNFIQTGNRILQVLQKEKTIALYYEDISNEKDKSGYLADYKEGDKKKSFELSEDTLMRVSVMRLGDCEYDFTWSFHHIIMDGWCIGILISEYFELYNSMRENRACRLPVVKPYRAYIAWLEKQDKETSARHWETYLGEYEETAGVPKFGSSGGSDTGYKEENVIFSLDREKTSGLNRLAAGNNVTLNTVIQAVWGIILGRYNDKNDVVFGAVVSGRPPGIEGVESMVGLFINTIPVRIVYNGDTKIAGLLKALQNAAVECEPHHYYPLAKIQAGSLLKQNLLDHILVFENYPLPQQSNGIDEEGKAKNDGTPLRISNLEVFEQTNYNFNVIIAPGDQLVIKLSYNAKVYPRNFVERIPHHLSLVLDQVLSDGTLTINDLTLLSAEEKQQVLYDFNNTEMEYPKDKTIHELFAEQTGKTPDRAAVVSLEQDVGAQHAVPFPKGHIFVTYKELNDRSKRLARLLREKSVGPDTIVGIMVDQSIELIVGILGILKAGGAYLPIDPQYPEERIDFMLKDSNAAILLTARELLDVCRGTACRALIYQGTAWGAAHPAHKGAPTNLAYIIYTSGTTGTPRGVMVGHRSLINLCYWHIGYYGIDECDHAAKYAGIGFDASVWEIFPYLITGASLYIIDDAIKLDINELNEFYERNDITISFLPTQFCEQFMELDNRSLRKLLTGGDKLRIFKKKNYELYNNYGPTENTVVCSACLVERYGGNIPIGKPIANNRIYIFDRNYLHLQPIGVVGELCIGGDSLARGYLHDEALTAEKFIDNPVVKGERIYKTGDLARWLPDGNIEFLGRRDYQVKVRGSRIELGEIESRLLSHNEIKEAVVVLRDNKEAGDGYLCAYLVSDHDLSPAGLREYLALSLPDYMIPSYFQQIREIPLTPHGKVDRKALPELQLQAGKHHNSPRSELEKKLVKIWCGVLGRDASHASQLQEIIGIDDNFFELGGHSLNATILVSGIHKEFNVKVSLAEIFNAPTIRGLAQYIKGTLEDKYPSIEAVEEKEYYTLSPAQKRIYAFQRMGPSNIVYNIPLVIPLPGDVDRQKLKNVFKRIIARHESLRTSFQTIANKPVQRIHDEVKFEIEQHTPAHGSPFQERIVKDFVRPFDLANAPLLRVGLMETANREHILMLDMHHIITDGVSQDILQKEFIALWQGEELPPTRLRYKDYTEWLNSKEHRELLKRQGEYWRREFSGELPVLNLPQDYPRPKMRSFEGRSLVFILEKENTRMLKELAQKEGATMYMILLAIFNILLYKLCRQEDIIVGTITAGRRHVDLQNLIGFFINPLALRNYPSGEKSFIEFLREVMERTLQAFDNQDYQYDDLVELAADERDPGRNPIFDVLFALQNQPGQPGNLPEAAPPGNRQPFEFKLNRSLFDMNLVAVEAGGILRFVCEYNTKLYKEETIKRYIEYFKEIITSVLDHNHIQLQDIKISHGLAVTTKDTPEMDFGF